MLNNPVYQPSCRIYNSAAITLVTGVTTALTFNSERYDLTGMHEGVTNPSRITINVPGKYIITGNVAFAANAAGYRNLSILLNGATSIAHNRTLNHGAGQQSIMLVATQYNFAAGDYIELMAEQGSGGNLDVAVSGNISPEFAACRIAD